MPVTVTRRTEGLIVRSVGAETVVFDTATEQVTCLDAVTARVWAVLDEERTVDQLAAASDLPQEEVVVALARLSDAGLLAEQAGVSRRSLLRGAGTVAVAAPLMTIMAPAPAFAQSPPTGAGRTVTGAQVTCTGNGSNRTERLSVTVSGFVGFTSGTLTVTYLNNNNATTTFSTTVTINPTTGIGTTTFDIVGVNSGTQTATLSFTAGTAPNTATATGTAQFVCP